VNKRKFTFSTLETHVYVQREPKSKSKSLLFGKRKFQFRRQIVSLCLEYFFLQYANSSVWNILQNKIVERSKIGRISDWFSPVLISKEEYIICCEF
jgi:hypothetical protein